MAFFRNDHVNLLNLHHSIQALAASGGGAFLGAFLLRQGLPLPIVLLSLATILLGRFILRPWVLWPARRWGLKPLVIAGTILCALQYPILPHVHGPGWALAAFILVSAVGETLYWTTYHAYYAALGDEEDRGQQIGVREAAVALVGIGAPLLTAWGLMTLGPSWAFGATALVLLLAALPLLHTPNVTVQDSAPSAFPSAWPAVLMFAADGALQAGLFLVWPLVLFKALGENFTAYGGAMAVAALAGAACGLWLGRTIDMGHGVRAVWVFAGMVLLVALFRIASQDNPYLAIAANTLGALLPAVYAPTLMTAIYNQAKSSPCVMRFNIATEGGADIGSASGCIAAAGIIAIGAPASAGVGVALIGLPFLVALLWRYYRTPRGRRVSPDTG
ncbi:MAG: hypothetical protein IM662_08255 [Phenylobacterium sp.]|jgi:DHA1 family inner membrane transport protein|uniref:MFS transporter n=1 Tax=Phenylobacterium sp. TaxID=1871053 RepID=UPI0025E56A29|nr:MFS transporter [Phenylobacterium sp.]MCA3386622.1 hypothetical protein [Roseomonas sp.]MCA3644386.1 hypothetical protein [Methylobacterium sp.]MCA3723225.1 hypothetical protein [Phenylobacterium sp.]MCA6242437.1 hypothetical protein [Phenylobacterium sp.]MCA6277735.1 hypothetical protein [Phenylobacterium sp.]